MRRGQEDRDSLIETPPHSALFTLAARGYGRGMDTKIFGFEPQKTVRMISGCALRVVAVELIP